MSEKKVANKYCLVPGCPNTFKNAPEKWFINVPFDIKIRKVWQTAMRREVFVSNKSHVYCCEDHFKKLEEAFAQQLEEQERIYGPVTPLVLPSDLPDFNSGSKRSSFSSDG